MGKFISLELTRSLTSRGAAASNPKSKRARPDSDATTPGLYLIVHLGMTGRLGVRAADEPIAPHTHVFFELDDGRELRYTDIRRFGRILLVPAASIEEFRAKLGADALGVAAAEFTRQLAGRHARIKALLLDQRVFRGIGNIYADETLWNAGIHPAQVASKLGAAELKELRRAMQLVLRTAIRLRGSSISNFVDADGKQGGYQSRHRVYGREGKPCARCGTTIRRIIVAGRSSFFCPRCQPIPRARRVRGKQDRAKQAKDNQTRARQRRRTQRRDREARPRH